MSVAQVTEAAGKTREMTAEAYQALVERAEAALQAARDKVGAVASLTAQLCAVTKLPGQAHVCWPCAVGNALMRMPASFDSRYSTWCQAATFMQR